jgi:hypothetical protein
MLQLYDNFRQLTHIYELEGCVRVQHKVQLVFGATAPSGAGSP